MGYRKFVIGRFGFSDPCELVVCASNAIAEPVVKSGVWECCRLFES